jgi:hypothetical protein
LETPNKKTHGKAIINGLNERERERERERETLLQRKQRDLCFCNPKLMMIFHMEIKKLHNVLMYLMFVEVQKKSI